ncbi:MAG: uracil-DNA glycosylase [Bdellovibrionia bacterium]
MAHPSNPSQIWTHAWKSYLPARAIVMARKAPSLPPPSNNPLLIHNINVLGEGNPHAELVFVGESLGDEEDLLGRPFVGEAGQLLDRMIAAMGLKREQVYIASIVKCRPEYPNPEAVETQKYGPFMASHLAKMRPKVIVALGKFAAQTLLQSDDQISTLRGKFYPYGETLSNIQVMPTFDPSYLLQNPASKRETWADLQQVAKVLGIVIPKR